MTSDSQKDKDACYENYYQGEENSWRRFKKSLKDHLHVSKFCCVWMPRSSIENQKTRLVKWYLGPLKMCDAASQQVTRHDCNIIMCWPSFKMKLGSLKTRINPSSLFFISSSYWVLVNAFLLLHNGSFEICKFSFIFELEFFLFFSFHFSTLYFEKVDIYCYWDIFCIYSLILEVSPVELILWDWFFSKKWTTLY